MLKGTVLLSSITGCAVTNDEHTEISISDPLKRYSSSQNPVLKYGELVSKRFRLLFYMSMLTLPPLSIYYNVTTG